jgi:hypothetical protein
MHRARILPLIAAASIIVVSACGEGSSSSGAAESQSPSAAQGPPPPAKASDFDPANFSRPTEVTNPWFPLEPGTRFTWEGHATDEGERIARQVVFTVTDLTKVVNGVRTVVTYDRDSTGGELEEVELSFFAQDDDGNVWYLGEYPEELDGTKIVKTATWISGLHGARAGIHMPADPQLGTPSYAMGWGGTDVHWNDRGQVDRLDQDTCVPLDCYTGVVVIDEFNPDEPGTHQLKFYASGVGGIRVGWRGANETEREVLELVTLEHLSPGEMDSLRETALAQEARAYRLSPDVYGTTDPIDQA